MIKISEILEIGSNKKYIDNLIKECKKENIIPFIGAGMSVPIYDLKLIVWPDSVIENGEMISITALGVDTMAAE